MATEQGPHPAPVGSPRFIVSKPGDLDIPSPSDAVNSATGGLYAPYSRYVGAQEFLAAYTAAKGDPRKVDAALRQGGYLGPLPAAPQAVPVAPRPVPPVALIEEAEAVTQAQLAEWAREDDARAARRIEGLGLTGILRKPDQPKTKPSQSPARKRQRYLRSLVRAGKYPDMTAAAAAVNAHVGPAPERRAPSET